MNLYSTFNIMDSYNENLHKRASSKLYEYAKELRKDGTRAEELLWQRIRSKQIAGLKFRRQHPLDKFIADFYCHEKKLVIELDGGVHNNRENKQADEGRTYELHELNITVIRFRNEEVIENIEEVINTIIEIASDRNK